MLNRRRSAMQTLALLVGVLIDSVCGAPMPNGPPFSTYQMGNGEYANFMLDLDGTPYGISGNLLLTGSNNQGVYAGANRLVTTPADLKFKQISGVLHGGMGVDVNGYVWTWGDGAFGQIGNGDYAHQNSPVKIEVDYHGNPFNGVRYVESGLLRNPMCFAIKHDGTLWAWGDLNGGFTGNGTAGDIITRPIQVPVPGVPEQFHVKDIALHTILIVLRSDGTVWTLGGGSGGNPQNLGYGSQGNDYASLHKLNLEDIVGIAGGSSFNYAVHRNGTLFGWGFWYHHMGDSCGYCPWMTPRVLTKITSAFPAGTRVAQVSTTMVASYAILSDGSLWGWGDNTQGSLGVGTERDFLNTAGQPYSWDFAQCGVCVFTPVRIAPWRRDFVALSVGNPYVFYKHAVTCDNTVYAMGRNKGGVIGNGILSCSSDLDATNPNAHDVTLATPITPLALRFTANITVATMPYCGLVNRAYGACASTACNRAGVTFGAPPDNQLLPPSGLYTGCLPDIAITGRCHNSSYTYPPGLQGCYIPNVHDWFASSAASPVAHAYGSCFTVVLAVVAFVLAQLQSV